MSKYIYFLLILFVPNCLTGQYNIRFLDDNLLAARQIAETEGKKVFVDTYAPWCVPCKKMEKLFRDPEVADFFNNHFISVRINMDGELGKFIHTKYEVVFLPTLLILDTEGNIILKEDRLLTKGELLDMGSEAVFSTPSSAVISKPIIKPAIQKSKETKISSILIEKSPEVESDVVKSDEKILYVLGDSSDVNDPEYLYNVAYLHLQLNSKERHSIAASYLKTQNDWSTEKNLNFIYDFLYKTNSKLFEYFIENRTAFEELKGKQEVAMTIDIMVHAKLYQGFPRPGFEETRALLSFIDPGYGERQAYAYILDRYLIEKKFDDYLRLAGTYIDQIDPQDDGVLYQICKINIQQTDSKADPKENLKLIKRAIEINPTNYKYYDLMAWMYYKKGMKKKALNSAQKALDLAQKKGLDASGTLNLIELIKEL